MSGPFEIEIKLPVESAAAARRLLRRVRARSLGRVHEMNTLFDRQDHALGNSGRLLRVRRLTPAGNGRQKNVNKAGAGKKWERGLVTLKIPAEGGRYKVREELEMSLDNPERCEEMLKGLGFGVWFRYEKYRTTFRLPCLPKLSVELDETPVGDFLELEGEREAIDRAAERLGYGPNDYSNASYYEIFQRERERVGLPPHAMLFSLKK